MAEPAKIMAIGDQPTPDQAETAPDDGRKQLSGESAMWFRRYCLYRDLGHKRSLRAAVAKEREIRKAPLRLVKGATKSPKNQKDDAAQSSAILDVPGSWKNASKLYRWRARAQAFDAWLLNEMVELTYEALGDSFANKYKRVQYLDALINAAIKTLNSTIKSEVDHNTYLAYLKRIGALLQQMEGEMARLPEEGMKAAIMAYGRTMRDEIEQGYHGGKTRVDHLI